MTTSSTTKTQWNLDASHSEIGFKVKHLMISNVSGSFAKFDVSVETQGDNFSTAQIAFSADINSLSTGNDQRDGHLKSGDFFDAENYPEMVFNSESLENIDETNYKLKGNLSLKGITAPVTLNVEYGGLGTDPWGNQKVGFTLSGRINRNDWQLTWNAPLETGGVLVGEEVKIYAELQFSKTI